MYSAERQQDPKNKFLFEGNFGETVDWAVRPTVVLYEVSTLTFNILNNVPHHYSLGIKMDRQTNGQTDKWANREID